MARRRALRQEKNTCGEGCTGPGPRTHTPRAGMVTEPLLSRCRLTFSKSGRSTVSSCSAMGTAVCLSTRHSVFLRTVRAAVLMLQSSSCSRCVTSGSRPCRVAAYAKQAISFCDRKKKPRWQTRSACRGCGAGRPGVRPCAAQPGAWPEALGATQWGTAGQQPPSPLLPLRSTARARCCTHPHPQPSPRRRPSLCPAAPAHLLGSPRQRGEARDCHPAQHRALAPQVELEDVQGGAIDMLKVVVVQELKRTRQRSERLARPAELPAGLGQGTRAGHSPGRRQEGPQRALSASPLPSASCPQPSFPPPALREAALATRPTSTKTAMVPMSW